MMKRRILLALIVVLAFAMLPTSAWADEWTEGIQDGWHAFLNFLAWAWYYGHDIFN